MQISAINSWEKFVEFLSSEVNWHTPDYTAESELVESALRKICSLPQEIEKQGERILKDENLFGSLKDHCEYPAYIMDKFLLHIDPEDRFRVRLHRFKTAIQNGQASEWPHQHKWPMSTYIIRGSYIEHRYRIEELNETSKSAHIRLTSSREYTAGQSNSMTIDQIHRIECTSQEPAITLFVRGTAKAKCSRIFPINENRYYDFFNPDEQLRLGYREITKLNPFFH